MRIQTILNQVEKFKSSVNGDSRGGEDDLDAARRGHLGFVSDDVHWQECRFLEDSLAELPPPSVGRRLAHALRSAECPHRETAAPPSRQEHTPVRFSPQIPRRLCHSSPPFDHARS